MDRILSALVPDASTATRSAIAKTLRRFGQRTLGYVAERGVTIRPLTRAAIRRRFARTATLGDRRRHMARTALFRNSNDSHNGSDLPSASSLSAISFSSSVVGIGFS
jgi:hypothetical protein